MKRSLTLIAALALSALSGAARAESFGYVDVNRVYSEASEPRRIGSELQADQQTKQIEIQSATAAVKQAKPSDAPTLQRKADEMARLAQTDLEQHQHAAGAALSKRLGELTAKLRVERHLSAVLPVVPLAAPAGLDLTDEVIRRWNAADAVGMAAELAKARAELAAAKAAKPEPPKK